jgi:hypothetical protein
MNTLVRVPLAAALAALTSLSAATANAADAAAAPVRVAGEKVDSGLGELPHYNRWRTHVAGEKIDSGLADLPHYSKWADPTGKNPLRVAASPKRDEQKTNSAAERVAQSK